MRLAQLKGHYQQLEQIEEKVSELIAKNPPAPEDKKEVMEDAFDEDDAADVVTIAANKIVKIRALKLKAKTSRDERLNHLNLVLNPVTLKNICKEGSGGSGKKKGGSESIEEELVKNVLQVVHRRELSDKAEIKVRAGLFCREC